MELQDLTIIQGLAACKCGQICRLAKIAPTKQWIHSILTDGLGVAQRLHWHWAQGETLTRLTLVDFLNACGRRGGFQVHNILLHSHTVRYSYSRNYLFFLFLYPCTNSVARPVCRDNEVLTIAPIVSLQYYAIRSSYSYWLS
jgi:hypothetical protein